MSGACAGVFCIIMWSLTAFFFVYSGTLPALEILSSGFIAAAFFSLPLVCLAFFLLALNQGPQCPVIGFGAALIIFGCLIVNADHIQKFIKSRVIKCP